MCVCNYSVPNLSNVRNYVYSSNIKHMNNIYKFIHIYLRRHLQWVKWWCYLAVCIEIDLYLNRIQTTEEKTKDKEIYIYTNVTEDDFLALFLRVAVGYSNGLRLRSRRRWWTGRGRILVVVAVTRWWMIVVGMFGFVAMRTLLLVFLALHVTIAVVALVVVALRRTFAEIAWFFIDAATCERLQLQCIVAILCLKIDLTLWLFLIHMLVVDGCRIPRDPSLRRRLV